MDILQHIPVWYTKIPPSVRGVLALPVFFNCALFVDTQCGAEIYFDSHHNSKQRNQYKHFSPPVTLQFQSLFFLSFLHSYFIQKRLISKH